MSKGKRGPALIELIHRQNTDAIRRPTWFGSRPVHSASQPARSGERPAGARAPVDPSPVMDPAPPLVAVRGERVVLSFSSVSAGVAVFTLIVLLGGSFLAGHRTGERKGIRAGFQEGAASMQAGAVGEIEAARRSAPNTSIFDGVGNSPVTITGAGESAAKDRAPTAAPTEPSEPVGSPWVQGHTYVVVQEFKGGDRADAEAAQLFLRDHGIETAVLESGGRYKYRLVALKGFNRDAPAQRQWCDEYHARIRELGRLFVKAGGRYDLQGYQKKLTGPGW